MKKAYTKKDFPVSQIRKYLEPGPVVLVSSQWKGEKNIMTMAWHTVMEFTPSLVGCVISSANHSYELIRKSRECVINIPEAEMIGKVIGIGNCSGDDTDKFSKFGLTAQPAEKVKAPLIRECYANFECRIADTSMLRKYNFFIFEVLKAHVAVSPEYPKTVHYTGEGVFMFSGKHAGYARKFSNRSL